MLIRITTRNLVPRARFRGIWACKLVSWRILDNIPQKHALLMYNIWVGCHGEVVNILVSSLPVF